MRDVANEVLYILHQVYRRPLDIAAQNWVGLTGQGS